jgi:hypothetical protein
MAIRPSVKTGTKRQILTTSRGFTTSCKGPGDAPRPYLLGESRSLSDRVNFAVSELG